MTIQTHRDLDVWKVSLDLVDAIYDLSLQLPHNERFSIVKQMTRAAVSIAANIAEGFGRRSDKELLNFLNIVRGSLSELDTYLVICLRRKWVGDEDLQLSNDLAVRVSKMLFKLTETIKSRSHVITT